MRIGQWKSLFGGFFPEKPRLQPQGVTPRRSLLATLFPVWTIYPALALLCLGVVPDHEMHEIVAGSAFGQYLTGLLSLIDLDDAVTRPIFSEFSSLIRPDIALWLKAAPQDVVGALYLVSIYWGSFAVIFHAGRTTRMSGICTVAHTAIA